MTPEQTQTCDVMVSLPMHGQASSLNLSVAAGILLYAMLK
jgi:tRNA G18 (ribose-2'-O)-methylase SpoU